MSFVLMSFVIEVESKSRILEEMREIQGLNGCNRCRYVLFRINGQFHVGIGGLENVHGGCFDEANVCVSDCRVVRVGVWSVQ